MLVKSAIEYGAYRVNRIQKVKKNFYISANFSKSRKLNLNLASPVNQGMYYLANELIQEQIYRANFYLLAYLLNCTTPCISVAAAPIGSKKIGHVGGHTVSQAPGPDQNRRGARGFFGPP